MAIVGGALIPPATGFLGDHFGLGLAFLLPAACYLVIAAFGWSARKPAQQLFTQDELATAPAE